jgi:hypothetical protein
MPEPARRLFRMHADRRLLPEGWLYNDRTNELVGPSNEPVKLGLIAAYPWVVALARELAPESMADWLKRQAA